MSVCVCERERDRQTERERERERDRDREKERQRETERDRERQRETERQREMCSLHVYYSLIKLYYYNLGCLLWLLSSVSRSISSLFPFIKLLHYTLLLNILAHSK